jgi:hypothetical protein
MAASYDESPDINKQKVIEKQEKYHHCFVEKQSKKQEYLDSGGKGGERAEVTQGKKMRLILKQ